MRGPRLALTYAPREAGAAVAFAIPAKVGGAVVRNRTRRRVRALLDERARAGGLRPGVYLVHVPARLDDLDSSGLRSHVDQLLDALDTRVAGAAR